MDDVLGQVERQLIAAIHEHHTRRRARRRRLVLTLALAGALLLAVSGASAISGKGPVADVLGVDRDDPTLGSVDEIRDAPRAVVRARGDDGHAYTFAAFHARRSLGPDSAGRSLCSTQTRDDATRIPGLGCIPPVLLAKTLRRDGILGGPYWGGSQAGGLRATKTASGLVPGDARSVTLHREGEPAVQAKLSAPIPISLSPSTRLGQTRAFLAVDSHDADGAPWLGPPVRSTISVVLADGTTRRQTSLEPQFFPTVDSVRPQTTPIHMGHAGYPLPWRSVSYSGKRGILCTAAAPAGERLITRGKLQCSSPLAVVNALRRYGAAVYISNPNPRRERGRRSVAVFGFTRADARAITVVDRRGRRYRARITRPWGSAVRQQRDLAGIDGELRRRLERLPSRQTVRSWITSLDLPPKPTDCGLRLEVTLNDGRTLRNGPGLWRCRTRW
jgi:hypothetical protein